MVSRMPNTIVVAGVTSLYTAVGIDGFPLHYQPTARPKWLACGVGGAAGHIAKVMRSLGDNVRLCTVVGDDPAGAAIRADLAANDLLGPGVVRGPASTSGVVSVGPDGQRMGYGHLRPLDGFAYPPALIREQAAGADLVVATNARFVRRLLPSVRDLGVPIAVDVHLIKDLEDPYNLPWLEAAEVVFCSHERLPWRPGDWIARLLDRYPRCVVAGVGLGADGLLIGLRDGRLISVGAVAPRGVVNTSGAGDSAFATFLQRWVTTGDPASAAEDAVLLAGWKIGSELPSSVSMTTDELAELRAAHPVRVTVSTL